MDKIQQIQEAIDKAERLESKLTDKQFEIGGFTSKKIRHLMNNLGAISTNYLEVGVHLGSLFMAANYGNQFETSTAVDNFSEFNENNPKKQFLNNMETMRYLLLDQNCWTIEGKLYRPIDLYLYDAGHSLEEQARAVTHFAPMMADEFIMCIDDYAWGQVHEGTAAGINRTGLEIIKKWELGMADNGADTNWWNGYGVFLLRKPHIPIMPSKYPLTPDDVL